MNKGPHIVIITLTNDEKLTQEYKTLSEAQRRLNSLLKELNEQGCYFIKVNRELINCDKIRKITIVPQLMMEKENE